MLKLYIANKNYSSWSLRPWVLMRELGIPFQGSVKASGTHRWEYWRDELFTAWPVLMKALDARISGPIPEAPSSGLADGLGSSQS